MVAGDQAEVAFVLGGFVLRQVLVEESVDAAAAVRGEVAVVMLPVQRVGGVATEQVIPVAVPAPVQVEVHVESGPQRLLRHAPFGDERGFGILVLDGAEHLTPGGDGGGFGRIVVLDQRIGHVHAETVATLTQPEAHDIDHGLPCLGGRGGVRAHLPGALGVREAVVERRLAFEEVQHIGAVARGFAADERQAVGAGEPRIGPDVPVGVLVALRATAGAEPGVLLAGVARDQIQQHVHAAPMGFVEQGDQVVVGAVARGDLEVVAHVVARVLEGRVEARVDPQRVAAEVADVVEPGDDAGDVADAVAVRIGEALRVDLVESRVGEPLGAWEDAGHRESFPSVGVGGVPVVGPVLRRWVPSYAVSTPYGHWICERLQ